MGNTNTHRSVGSDIVAFSSTMEGWRKSGPDHRMACLKPSMSKQKSMWPPTSSLQFLNIFHSNGRSPQMSLARWIKLPQHVNLTLVIGLVFCKLLVCFRDTHQTHSTDFSFILTVVYNHSLWPVANSPWKEGLSWLPNSQFLSAHCFEG